MRLRNQDMPLDPDVERELAAIEAGLAGLEVPPHLEELADLARELRAERDLPETEFAARLDEWAADGFPREGRPGQDAGDQPEAAASLRRLGRRLAAVPPRRLLAPVGAAAALLVLVGVAITESGELGGSGGAPEAVSTQPAGQRSEPSTEAPNQPAPEQLQGSGGQGASPKAAHTVSPALSGSGSTADSAQTGSRKVAQTADLVLSAEPAEVREVADGVVRVVDSYHGFVVSSNVTSGRPGPVPLSEGALPPQPQPLPSGTFRLRIPRSNLQAALADLSVLAHVTSRTEGTQDITRRFESAEQGVSDLEDRRERLLKSLADAFTLSERRSIKARLRIVEQQLGPARHRLAHLKQRVHLVPLSVQILAQKGVDEAGGGSWDIGDALHDAGRVLTVIAGILLVSAAILGPLALLGALAWLATRAVLRIRRERALG